MKKIVLILLCCISLGTIVYFLAQSSYSLQKEPVYIAVVGPMAHPNGKAMRQGVELSKEQINKQGGINGRKVEFIFRDDENNPKRAISIAHELVEENKVLLVLGHYYDSTSKAAGKIYKRNGLPAITASASAESVIRDNKWYFRSIPGEVGEAKFVAAYLFDILSLYKGVPLSELVNKSIPASIIFSKDEYGTSLVESFEKIAGWLKIELRGKWEWNYEKSSTEQLEIIKNELAAIDDPGVVYFATHASEAVKIITALKDEGQTYPMIVSSAVARSFFDKLKPYAKEWAEPGYYSDDIYFVSPFMLSLSGSNGFEFAQNFFAKYSEKPGVVSACYYDAVHIAVQAMKKNGIHGKKHIREDRRNIRKTLVGLYNEKNAVKGVTGRLWFDKTGGVKREYAVGRWLKQKSLPSFVQYDQNIGNVNDVLHGYLDGKVILTDDLVMSSTQIVYVGVENLQLIEINKEEDEFSAAFQLRFRYPARFDDPSVTSVIAPLEFSNALTPVILGKPIREEMKDGIVTKVFRVKAKFKTDCDLRSFFLFNSQQKLFIRFRHARQTYDNLIYIPETDDIQVSQLPDGWLLSGNDCYSDILSKKTSLGNPKYFNSDYRLDYSRFNAELTVEKEHLAVGLLLLFWPVVALAASLLLTSSLLKSHPGAQLFINITVLLPVTAVVYFQQSADLSAGHLTSIDYAYFIVYALLVLFSLHVVLSYRQVSSGSADAGSA